MERFGMENDYEDGQWIGGEFYGKRRQKRPPQTKDDVLFGVFASSSSDSDSDSKKRKRMKLGQSKPVNFVSSVPSQELNALKVDDFFLPTTALGKKIQEGVNKREKEKEKLMKIQNLSQAKKKESACNSVVGEFEKHTKGIGMKLLEKFGYKLGGGLGKNQQGIVAPIETKLRPKNTGIGFNDYKEQAVLLKEPDEDKPAVRSSWPKHAVKKKKPVNDIPMPELQHKIKLIVDSAELEIQDRRKERERLVALHKEKEKLQNNASQQNQQIEKMEVIASVLGRIDELCSSSGGSLTLESLAMSFVGLQTRFPDEYAKCNLSCIAFSYALPLFVRDFQGWDPIQDPEPPMIRFVESWENLLPSAMLQAILDTVIMPKIKAAVDSWDPCRATIPIHWWVHPWLRLLGQQLEKNCYQTICDKLSRVLHAWHPSDKSAFNVLNPWKKLFDPASWENLMVQHIVPKLKDVMQELQIDPADQKLDKFFWVTTWVTAIPTRHMLPLMDTFFDKWQQVLYDWLHSEKPNLEEVMKWYVGWKEQLPPELQANKHIKHRLFFGLYMMNQAADGKKVPRPSYLRLREQKQFETKREKATEKPKEVISDDFSFNKEVIETYAQQNRLLFKPKPGMMKDGHQIFGFGNVSIFVDWHNQKVFAHSQERWSLVTLKQLLDLHNRSM